MITLDDLIVKEGNGKVVLLNAKNGHWVRMRKDKYDMFCSSEKIAKHLKNWWRRNLVC